MNIDTKIYPDGFSQWFIRIIGHYQIPGWSLSPCISTLPSYTLSLDMLAVLSMIKIASAPQQRHAPALGQKASPIPSHLLQFSL